MFFLTFKIFLLTIFLSFFAEVPVKAVTTVWDPPVDTDFPSDQVYSDNFEDEKEGGSPSHWIENNRLDYWSVAREAGNNLYRVNGNEVSTYSWLHVFEKNVTFDVRFKVVDFAEENAELKFVVRFNDDEALVYVGYDFKTENWYMAEQRGKDFEQVNFEQVINVSRNLEPLKRGEWHHIRVLSNDETVTVYIDDMTRPKLWATDVRHQSPGRVALCARNATVDYDDVVLNLRSGQGRVNEGVLEYTIGNDDRFREGASIVEKSNGDLVLLHRSEEFHSSDRGQTFAGPYPFSWPQNAHGHHSVLRLHSGKLLNMVAERFGQGARFRAKLSSDDGATWVDGGVTWEAYREGLPGKSEVIVMNDKLTQMPDGRIFFVVPARKDDGEKVIGHKTEIYYSDDEGKTWHQSKNDSDDFTELSRYAEGKVIQTADGTLRLYTPWTTAHSVRYSESHDNGVNWNGDFALDQFRNARSSFALIQDTYAARTTYYMVWVYNNMDDTDIVFLPRSRLGLARSYDGVNWEYMMDVERWISPAKKDRRIITQILDPSLTATEKYLYVTIGRSDRAADNGHNHQRLRLYRIDKSKLRSYKAWPTEF